MTPSANSGKFTRGPANISPGYYADPDGSASKSPHRPAHRWSGRRGHLPKYTARTVVIVAAMPLNGNGKIAKPMPRKLITTQVGSESRDC